MSNLALFITPLGGEIVGSIVSEDADKIVIEHPLVLQPVNAGGTMKLDLFPHSLANPEGRHEFYKNTAVFSRSQEIPDQVERAYLERTSKIILASQLDRLERT